MKLSVVFVFVSKMRKRVEKALSKKKLSLIVITWWGRWGRRGGGALQAVSRTGSWGATDQMLQTPGVNKTFTYIMCPVWLNDEQQPHEQCWKQDTMKCFLEPNEFIEPHVQIILIIISLSTLKWTLREPFMSNTLPWDDGSGRIQMAATCRKMSPEAC